MQPKLDPVSIRFSKMEHDIINVGMKRSGEQTRSEFIRKAVLYRMTEEGTPAFTRAEKAANELKPHLKRTRQAFQELQLEHARGEPAEWDRFLSLHRNTVDLIEGIEKLLSQLNRT